MKTIMYIRANGIFSDSRATKEITTFLKSGYRVLVVGWDREGNSREKCAEVFENHANIEFCFFDQQVKDHVGFKNINKLYGWLKFCADVYKKNRSRLSVVHACNLDSCLLFYRQCRKDRIRLVYDIYDYYIDAHTIPSVLVGLIEQMEIDIINRADVTIICTEERREQIAKAKPKRVAVIHNTPDVERIDSSIEYDYFYCGTFCIRRLLEEILDGYEENADLRMGFAGYGIYKDKTIELDEKFDNFTYLNQIKYADCLKHEAKSVCLSAIYEPTVRNHRLCAPNKFYESLALGKPVIVCGGTGIDQVVSKYEIGIVIDYDVKQFYDAVRKLKQNPELCAQMDARARALYDEKYSWSIMEDVLLGTYSEIEKA